VEQYKGNKYFGGFGGTGELNFNVPFKKVDWRVIGVRTTMFYEDGRYASFRRMAEKDTLIENVNHYHGGFNVSACYEVIVKLDKVNFGYYSAIGTTFGIRDKPIVADTSSYPAVTSNERRNSITATWVLHLTHKQMTYFAQCSIGEWQGASVSGGITYRIHNKIAKRRINKKRN
jgi:hypothetical protein